MSGGYYGFPPGATSQYSTSLSSPANTAGVYAAAAGIPQPNSTGAYAPYAGATGQIAASGPAGFGYPTVTSSIGSTFTYSSGASANAPAGFHATPPAGSATAIALGSDLSSVKTVPAVNIVKAAGLGTGGAYTGYDAALYAAATSFVHSKAVAAAAQAQQAAVTPPVATAIRPTNWTGRAVSGRGLRGRYRGGYTGVHRQPQELIYCEVCKISCAGPTTYQEHLDGQRHKKKETQQKSESSGPLSQTKTSYRCNLCDVLCTGLDTYKAHVKGMKHQKAVKLHTVLGKPIPQDEPTVIPAGASASGQTGDSSKNSTSSVLHEEDTESSQPVGEDYIETIKENGKGIAYHCKLCDCKFNDLTAKDMHLKGRRHRWQYKEKVNPELPVDMKPFRGRGGFRHDRRMNMEMYHNMRAMYQAQMSMWGPGFMGPFPAGGFGHHQPLLQVCTTTCAPCTRPR